MKATIFVTDVFIRFRMAGIVHSDPRPQSWALQVMTIQDVARILVSLGFLDPHAADRLTNASTTITPQPGLTTVPFANFAALVETVYPEDEPASLEAQQTDVLITQGETTEDALATAGFVLRVNGPVQ